MYTILMIFYIVICLALIVTVLLQSAKGEGLAGAFGGGGGVSGAVFGGRGAANFLSRATTVLAILFMSMAIILSFMGPGRGGVAGGPSAVQKAGSEAAQSQPATQVPGAQPASEQPAEQQGSKAGEELFGKPAGDSAGK